MTTRENTYAYQFKQQKTSTRCPKCRKTSRRRHSTYTRTVQDTPIGSVAVLLRVKVRRFRCVNEDCERWTFAEQPPSLCDHRCHHRTHRLIANLAQIGLVLGDVAGARLANKLAMGASASTLLRPQPSFTELVLDEASSKAAAVEVLRRKDNLSKRPSIGGPVR